MVRPGNWFVLGGADPAPGNFQHMREAARVWGQNAGRLGEARDVLRGVTVEGAGATVDAVRTLLHRDAALIEVYRTACETNANAYWSWATSLEGFQAEADRLRVQAEQAQLEQAQGVALLRIQAPQSLFNDAPARPNPLQELWETDRRRGQGILASANQALAEIQRQADDLRERYKNEGNRVAQALHVPAPSDAAQQAHLDTSIPVGSGALTALLNPGKDPQLIKLNSLRDKLVTGNADARAEYLALLAALSPAQLALYGVWNPNKARSPIPAGTPVADAAAQKWWAALDPASKAALTAAVPGIIGNLNGLPYADRAKANGTYLDVLDNDPTMPQSIRNEIAIIRNNLVAVKFGPNRSLVSLELNEGKLLTAVAIGDMDTAQNVTWNIPGMGTTVADGLNSWTHSAQDLYDGQQGAFRDNQQNTTLAVVSWVGYQTPGLPPSLDVLGVDKAVAGADRLSQALDGFTVTRNSGAIPPQLHLVAHSYGTTTASYALKMIQHPVQTATFFGSAGIDREAVPNAAAMHVDQTHGVPNVYVTKAGGDNVAGLGIMGSPASGQARSDPREDWFGAHVFSSEGGYRADGGISQYTDGHDARGSQQGPHPFFATTGHGYLDPNTESARNIALTSTGHGEQIQSLTPLQGEDAAWSPRDARYPELGPR